MARIALAAAALLSWGVSIGAGFQSPVAAAERRVALVIGNGAYRDVQALANPAPDARLIAGTLRRLGFTLIGGRALTDLDRAGMAAAMARFHDAIQPGAVALFYYSGHGVQVDGTNFLVPVDSRPVTEADVPRQMVRADQVLADMAQAGAGLKILVLDACRDNPFTAVAGAARGLRLAAPTPAPAGGLTGLASGLAEMHAPPDSVISYATQPGGVASDGVPGAPDSPYTTALARSLPIPGQDVEHAFNRVGIEVGRLTGDAQEPWLAIASVDDVFLGGPPVAGAPPAPPLPAGPMMPRHPAIQMAAHPAPGVGPTTLAGAVAACPPAGILSVRGGTLDVRAEGEAAPGLCAQSVGGRRESRALGVWPANWPGAAQAIAATAEVLRGPAGTQARFTQSRNVTTLRDTTSSETWQFTLLNLGAGTAMVDGAARPTRRLLWTERNLARPYEAKAEIDFDAATGIVLSQDFRVVLGSADGAYEFWAPYAGGLAAVPNFRVTSLRAP